MSRGISAQAHRFSRDWRICLNCEQEGPLNQNMLCPTCLLGIPREQVDAMREGGDRIGIVVDDEILTPDDKRYDFFKSLSLRLAQHLLDDEDDEPTHIA